MNTKIAVKVRNPKSISDRFGWEAGEMEPGECQWWVGSPSSLTLMSSVPDGYRVITPKVKVQFCGGDAWLGSRETASIRRRRAGETFRAGRYYLGRAKWEVSIVRDIRTRGWSMPASQAVRKPLPSRPLPLP